jgi:hypothetical protein
MERFNLKKLNDVESKEQFRVEVLNRFAALEDLDAEVEINSAWGSMKENVGFELFTAVTIRILLVQCGAVLVL